MDVRYQRDLLTGMGEGPLSLPQKVGLWCLLNEAQRDPWLEGRLAGAVPEGGVARGPSEQPWEVFQRNRHLLERRFPGLLRPRETDKPRGARRAGSWTDVWWSRRRQLRRLARLTQRALPSLADYRRALAANLFLFEPFARLAVLMSDDLLEDTPAGELQYSFYSVPGFCHPPLDCLLASDGGWLSRLRVGARWAARLAHFRLRRLSTRLLAGATPEGVLSELLARRSSGRRFRLTYGWDGTIDLRGSPKVILSPGALELPGAAPPADRGRYLSPPMRTDRGPSAGPSDLPLVYCTLGTVVPARHPEAAVAFFRKIVAIFSRRPSLRLVASVWTDSCKELLRSAAPNVTIERSVIQDDVIRQSALAIHHSGHNTVLDCINNGVPMLVHPSGGTDQRGVAARVLRHGLALLAGPRDGEAELETKINRLLSDPAFRQRVLAMRDRIRAEAPPRYFEALRDAVGVPDLEAGPPERETEARLLGGTRRLIGALNGAHDKTVLCPRRAIPPALRRDHWKEVFPNGVPILFFDWDRIGDQETFRRVHLQGAADAVAGGLRPFALVGVSSLDRILDEQALTILVASRDGKAYLCAGSQRPRQIGYADFFTGVLRMAPPRGSVP